MTVGGLAMMRSSADVAQRGRSSASWAHRLRIWRSPAGQPGWARPALLGCAAAAGVAYGWQMGSSIEIYYAAAARSMSMSWHDFVFGAFDPAGTVSVDKLPGRSVVPGVLWPAFRRPHLGHRPAPGDRGRPHRPRPLPRRPSAGWGRGRHRGRRGAGGVSGGRHLGPGEHLRHAVDPPPAPGRGRADRCPSEWEAARGAPRRGVGRSWLPGEDGRGVAGPPGPGSHLRGRIRLDTAEPAPAIERDDGRRRSGLVELDGVRLAHAGVRASLRRRQPARLGVRAGLRLQRPGAGGRALPRTPSSAVRSTFRSSPRPVFRRGGTGCCVAPTAATSDGSFRQPWLSCRWSSWPDGSAPGRTWFERA